MMNRETLFHHLLSRYGTSPDYPWAKFPDYAVFRHAKHNKWFVLYCPISANKLGINADKQLEVINVKVPPDLVGELRMQKGIYPAYHMNKAHWVSVVLSECEEAFIRFLIDQSFDLTAK